MNENKCAGLQPVGWIHTGEGKKSMRRKEELLWTDYSPHSPKNCSAWMREEGKAVMNKEIKLGLVWSRVWGFSFVSVSHCLTLVLIGNKLNQSSSSSVCFALHSKWHGISLSLSQPMSFLILFFPPILLWRWNERAAGWAPDSQPRSMHCSLRTILIVYFCHWKILIFLLQFIH